MSSSAHQGGFEAVRLPESVWQRPETQSALRDRRVGHLFQLAKQYAGASQARIAASTGLNQSEVSRIQQGDRRVIAIDVLERIADGFDMPDACRMAFGLAPRASVAPLSPEPADPSEPRRVFVDAARGPAPDEPGVEKPQQNSLDTATSPPTDGPWADALPMGPRSSARAAAYIGLAASTAGVLWYGWAALGRVFDAPTWHAMTSTRAGQFAALHVMLLLACAVLLAVVAGGSRTRPLAATACLAGVQLDTVLATLAAARPGGPSEVAALARFSGMLVWIATVVAAAAITAPALLRSQEPARVRIPAAAGLAALTVAGSLLIANRLDMGAASGTRTYAPLLTAVLLTLVAGLCAAALRRRPREPRGISRNLAIAVIALMGVTVLVYVIPVDVRAGRHTLSVPGPQVAVPTAAVFSDSPTSLYAVTL